MRPKRIHRKIRGPSADYVIAFFIPEIFGFHKVKDLRGRSARPSVRIAGSGSSARLRKTINDFPTFLFLPNWRTSGTNATCLPTSASFQEVSRACLYGLHEIFKRDNIDARPSDVRNCKKLNKIVVFISYTVRSS